MRAPQAGSKDGKGLVRRIGGLSIAGILLIVGFSWAESVRTTSRLNLRQEPTTSSPRIVLLPAGAELEVISRRGVWIRVAAGGKEGWVHSEYVVDPALDVVSGDPSAGLRRTARDAELARDVALLRVGKLEREIESLRASAPDATRQNAELRARVAELSSRLEEREAQAAALVEEIAVAGDMEASPNAGAPPESGPPNRDAEENARLSKRVSELEGELASAREGARERDDETAELERRLAAGRVLGATLEAREAELRALTADQESLARQASDLEAALTAARGESDAQAEALDEARRDVAAGVAVTSSRLEALEAELVTTAALRDDLARQVDSLAAELADARAAIAGRDESLRGLEERLASATAARAALEDRALALESVTEERDAQAVRLARLEAQEAELARTVAGHDDLARQVDALTGELADARAAIAGRDESLRGLEERLALATAARAALEERALALENVAEERDAQSVDLARVADELANEQTRSRAAAEAADRERERLEARVAALAEERDLLAGSASTRERRISELEEALREGEKTLESLSGSLAENRDSAVQTAARERALAADRDRLAAEVSARDSALKTAVEQATAGAARVAALEQSAAEKDETLRAAQEALAVLRGERDQLSKMAAGYETEGRGYAEALLELQEWSDQAEDEIARLGTLNAELAATVANLEGKTSRRQDPLRRELEEAKARAQAAADRLVDAEREASRLRDELAVISTTSDASDSHLAVALGARTEAEEALRVARAELGALTSAREGERAARERSEAAARELEQQLAVAAATAATLTQRVTELEEAATAGDADVALEVAQLIQERDRLAQSLSAAEARGLDAATWRAEAERRVGENEAARRELAVANEQLEALRTDRAPSGIPLVAPAEPLADSAPLTPALAPAAEERDPRTGVIDAVRRWARAWSSQNVEDYLASYDGTFQPGDGLGRGEWMEQRRIRLRRPSFIEVEVSDLEIRVLSPDRVGVRFRQDYRSDSFVDGVVKTLELARIEGDWKIVREAAE